MKKLYTSIIALALTVVALGTGVFAWFTINNTATAGSFEGTVESAQGGFLISVDNGTTWTNKVDLKDVLSSKLSGKTFTDLTTEDGIKFTKLESTTGVTEGYITFDIDFAAINYTKVNAVTTITGTQTSWKSEYDVAGVKQGDLLASSAANALRVAYIQNGVVTKYIEAEEDYTGNNSVSGANVYKNTLGIPAAANNFALNYYNASGKTLTIPTNLLAQDATKSVQSGTSAQIASLSTTAAPVGYDGYTQTGKVTVNVWVEGWDAESFNAILSGKVTVAINFTAIQ